VRARLKTAAPFLVTLLVGVGGGYAWGSDEWAERADNCQQVAQSVYDVVTDPPGDDGAAAVFVEFDIDDDFCPVDQSGR